MSIVRIQKFTKRYNDFLAVDGLDLDIEPGDIFGLIGPNGAGKTTTIRFLATLLTPTFGDGWIAGHHVVREVDAVRRLIGFMPDAFGVYDGMRVWEFLDFFGAAYGLSAAKRKKVIDDVIALLDLTTKRDDLVNGLSRGMKQRLCLAKTLVHDPPVLILDEPASGLDPRARIEMKELLKELQRMGKTILISSHILSELADTCNKVGIIERGKLVAVGEVKRILSEVRQARILEIDLLGKGDEAKRIVDGFPGVHRYDLMGELLRIEFGGTLEEAARLHTEIVKAGVPVLWFREVPATLEEVFMKVTKGEVA